MKVLVAQSCLNLWDPMDCSPPGSSVYGDCPGKNTQVGCCSFLQRIFPIQRWNLVYLHCRPILYHLSHQGSHYLWEKPVLPVKPSWPFSEACIALRTLLSFSIHREGFGEEDSHRVNPQTLRRGSWFGPVLSSESLRAKVKMSWGCDSQKVPASGATWAKWKLWKYPGQEANK